MKKVLIVEDAKMIQKILTGIFTSNGFQVVGVANNGLEAIDLYFKLKPDLTTLDIRMPQMDGLEALKEMSYRDSTANEQERVGGKFMMVTSVDDDIKAVRRAGLYGASDYVKKPFKTEELLERVNRVLNEGYNFVKSALTGGEKENTSDEADSAIDSESYVIDSDNAHASLSDGLKESLDEIAEELSGVANSLIQNKNEIPVEELPPLIEIFDKIGTKLELEQLQEAGAFVRSASGYLKKMESCALPLGKQEVDILLASIDALEDSLEYILAHNGEEKIEEDITGRTMLKLIKRF